MVGTIRQAAFAVEQRSQFVAHALAARDEMRQSGRGHDAEEVRAYLRDRIGDKQTSRPEAKAWLRRPL